MFSSIESFYELFEREPPAYVMYRAFYYAIPAGMERFVVEGRSFRGAGVLLGEMKDEGFVPSLSALELLENRDSVFVDREGAWWFTNHRVVEFEEEKEGYVFVFYEDMLLGLGRFDKTVLVPVFDVGYFLRKGY